MFRPTLSAIPALPPLELWGGVECTLNRVGDRFYDQFTATGHLGRTDDLDLLTGIGFSALRYPISWERIAPDRPDECDWRWTDERLARLHARGLRVIAGLVHHGSGPRYTDLLDPGFAAGLAAHAAAAAERYEWIDGWTPVNEPLTTARFSALYGHWHPHHRDEPRFWLALLNQIDATRLAMRAIRRHNPGARLIQTEDLGRTYATLPLQDQAAFDNTRRWMSFDLLCGLVAPGHPFWQRLDSLGFGDRLRAIADDPCPPAVIGLNHYLTSDRFLDHRLRRYSGRERAGSDRQVYVDVEAVRVLSPPPLGMARSLEEAWQRYGLPIAITEVHNACTREEQLRWMHDAWHAALSARRKGIEVRAVTNWSVLGSSGWDRLLTAPGRLEAGVYDVSGVVPRPTALRPLLATLARGGEPDHPVLGGSGWWRRDIRLHHRPVPRPAALSEQRGAWGLCRASQSQPLLIVGATGTLGQALAAACRHRDIAYRLTGRQELDIEDEASIAAALGRHAPWVVINAAGWVRVDEAERDEAACFAINAAGAEGLARACAARGIASVCFSSDLVFGGAGRAAYDEGASPAPINAYGRSKAEAERRIAALDGNHLVVRTAAFFSPFDRHNFAVHAYDELRAGNRFCAAEDEVVTPTYVPDLCNAVLDLVIDGETGLWHLTNEEACSWAVFAARVAQATGLGGRSVAACPGASLGVRAPRPAYVPLVSRRGKLMPSLGDALARFAREMR